MSFSIAVQKRTKPTDPNEPDASFFRISAWNQTAEYVSNYVTKGRLVAVDGRLDQRKYTDSNGQQREIIEIVADNVQALDRPREDGAGGGGMAPSGGGGRASTAPSEAEYDPFADE